MSVRRKLPKIGRLNRMKSPLERMLDHLGPEAGLVPDEETDDEICVEELCRAVTPLM